MHSHYGNIFVIFPQQFVFKLAFLIISMIGIKDNTPALGSKKMNGFDKSKIDVLVVEDETFISNLITQILLQFGVNRVEVASNAENAKFLLANGYHPDVIFTDQSMRGGNGTDLISWVRKDKLSPNQMVPIIMVSGNTELSVITNARDVGVNKYLAKPISAELLIKRLATVFEKTRPFVKSDQFFGPDRRRRVANDLQTDRRKKTPNSARSNFSVRRNSR